MKKAILAAKKSLLTANKKASLDKSKLAYS